LAAEDERSTERSNQSLLLRRMKLTRHLHQDIHGESGDRIGEIKGVPLVGQLAAPPSKVEASGGSYGRG
jgi:hypothetical protein